MNFTFKQSILRFNWRQWVCILRKKREGKINDPNIKTKIEKKCPKNMR